MALQRIGALNLKAILLKANAVFPNSKPPRDIEKRQKYLDEKLGDKQFTVWLALEREIKTTLATPHVGGYR